MFFDDFTVEHVKSPVVQMDGYYPFGLTFNSYAKENTTQNHLYNGMELQDELDLGWYDYFAREYDASLGRFLSVDPAAESMRRHGIYNYAFDNPIRFTDPDGMVPEDTNDCGTDEECEEKRKEKFKAWLEKARKDGKVANVYNANDGEGDEDAQQGGPGDPNDPLDVSDIPSREPYGLVEYFFFGGIEDNGVWYNRDGTPRVKGVVTGTPPSWVGGPAGGLRTMGQGVKLLVQQNGIWRHASNGRVASKETLRAAGLLKPNVVPTVGKPTTLAEFQGTASGVPNSGQPLSFWGKVKRIILTAGQIEF